MATQHSPINDNGWTNLGTGLQACVIQPSGDCRVVVSATAPAETDPGFFFKSGVAVEVPQVAALGGGVWIRGDGDVGGVIYAVA